MLDGTGRGSACGSAESDTRPRTEEGKEVRHRPGWTDLARYLSVRYHSNESG
jgi:hypothetical protein